MPEITYGRWNPSEIRDRIVDNTWTGVEVMSGLEKIVPTSINFSGESALLNPSTGFITFKNISFIRVNGLFTSTYALYRMISDISGNVFEGTNLRVRVSLGPGNDTTSGNYNWNMKYHYASTWSGSQGTSDTSWMLSQITQQSFPDDTLFYRNPSAANSLSFFRKGIFDDNVRDDTTYALHDTYGNMYVGGDFTSLYFFPQNNLEFITGSMLFYGYK